MLVLAAGGETDSPPGSDPDDDDSDDSDDTSDDSDLDSDQDSDDLSLSASRNCDVPLQWFPSRQRVELC